jgi:hypothetical protein
MRDVPDLRLSVSNPIRVGEFLRKAELVSLEEPRIDVREAGDPHDRVDARFALLSQPRAHDVLRCRLRLLAGQQPKQSKPMQRVENVAVRPAQRISTEAAEVDALLIVRAAAAIVLESGA